MSSTTPRLSIVKPALIDSPKNFDYEVGSALEKIDLFFGCPESAADPTPTFVGQIYKNTTTENYRRWDGVKWAWIGHQTKFADSFESLSQSDGLWAGAGGPQILVSVSNSFTFVQNHWYKIRFMAMLEYDASTAGFFRVRLRQGNPVTDLSTIIREFRYFVDSTGFMTKQASGYFDYFHAAATGSGEIGMYVQPETAVDFHVSGGAGSGGSNTADALLVISDGGT